MKCINCGTINEEDAVFCKKCGFNLEIENEEYIKNDDNYKEKKGKTKTKKKVKKKKVKEKRKQKNNRKNNKKTEVRKEMSFSQSLLMLFLFILCIILFGALAIFAYYEYKSQNIVVPNVINMSYEDAKLTLENINLSIEKIEVETENQDENNIILKQSKKEGKKVSKGSIIKVTVGKYVNNYYLDDFTNMNINNAISIIEENNLKYKIMYKESDEDENTVISQKPKVNTKMKENQTVILTVSKSKSLKENKEEKEKDIKENEKDEEEERKIEESED